VNLTNLTEFLKNGSNCKAKYYNRNRIIERKMLYIIVVACISSRCNLRYMVPSQKTIVIVSCVNNEHMLFCVCCSLQIVRKIKFLIKIPVSESVMTSLILNSVSTTLHRVPDKKGLL